MTTEEHRKEVRGRLISMLKCAEAMGGQPEKIGPIVYDMGVLLSHLSEISEISSQRLENQTNALIDLTRGLHRLTRWIVILTAALLIFTICLVIRG